MKWSVTRGWKWEQRGDWVGRGEEQAAGGQGAKAAGGPRHGEDGGARAVWHVRGHAYCLPQAELS